MDRFTLLAAKLHREFHPETCYRGHRSPSVPGSFECQWAHEESVAREEGKSIDWKKGAHGHYYARAERIYNAVRDIWNYNTVQSIWK